MRPRPDAAENLPDGVRLDGAFIASMRPRPDAAENSSFFRASSASIAALQ